ncbi:hypothetical protein ACF8EA_10510 [Pseudomonas sp. YQ_5]
MSRKLYWIMRLPAPGKVPPCIELDATWFTFPNAGQAELPKGNTGKNYPVNTLLGINLNRPWFHRHFHAS